MSKLPQESPSEHNAERRSFFKYSAAFLASITILPYFKGLSQAFAATNPPLSEKDPMAKSLGYHADATKVKTKDFPKRPKGADQFCHNCQFYTAIPNEKTHGNCALFQQNTVTSAGWCNSWTKKA
jgi:hypothetical protein